MVSIPLMKDDDPQYLAVVRSLTVSNVRGWQPVDVFVVRIDHWFDYKWFAFAGKLLGALAFHKKRLTIPPFIPDRVVSENAFTLKRGSVTYEKGQAPSLHRYQSSGENLSRFISHVTKSGIFVWFSGDTAHTEHGSIMMYLVRGETHHGWYASFRRREDWQLYKVRGLSKAEL